MRIFTPDLSLDGLRQVTPQLLAENGISWLAVDLDNTIAYDCSNEMPQKNLDWLARMKAAGIPVTVISNNKGPRVESFAQISGLTCISRAGKPFGDGVARAAKLVGRPLSECALIGDQIFTDIWAARRAGVFAVLVRPLGLEPKGFLAFKRRLELLTKAGRARGRRAQED